MALKLNLGAGDKPLEGFVNLDRRTGWYAELGLPYDPLSVDAITISHMLMYVHPFDWPQLFEEFFRVLKSGGIVRITEDNTADRRSERYGGNPNDPELRALTSPSTVFSALHVAGFRVYPGVHFQLSMYRDDSLCQAWHGLPPKVFFIEGEKPAW